jgi:CTD kinase subunit gamma
MSYKPWSAACVEELQMPCLNSVVVHCRKYRADVPRCGLILVFGLPLANLGSQQLGLVATPCCIVIIITRYFYLSGPSLSAAHRFQAIATPDLAAREHVDLSKTLIPFPGEQSIVKSCARSEPSFKMADPFEVRMRFTSHLQQMNASTNSALKAANYALRYVEFSDDLHSCILEQLERNNMNNRANIMYFLPALCDAARNQGELGYIRMMERDILRIIDLVAPDDGSGAANVKVVRKVLQQLQQKTFLQPQTVKELDECITGRESMRGMPPSPSGANGLVASDVPHRSARSSANGTSRDSLSAGNSAIRLDKRQIEQRIEEDRERHKRAREGIWAIAQAPGTNLGHDAEFETLWSAGSDADSDDLQVAKEEAEERRRHLEFDET